MWPMRERVLCTIGLSAIQFFSFTDQNSSTSPACWRNCSHAIKFLKIIPTQQVGGASMYYEDAENSVMRLSWWCLFNFQKNSFTERMDRHQFRPRSVSLDSTFKYKDNVLDVWGSQRPFLGSVTLYFQGLCMFLSNGNWFSVFLRFQR